MNSLEFIDREIKENEKSIRKFNNLLKGTLDDKALNKCIEIHQNNINQLNQIKTELEAWEEIKKYLVLNEGCIYEDSYYEYLTLQNDCIDETESEEQGVSLKIIKKALEVKDEDRN